MCTRNLAPARGALGFATGLCALGSLMMGCSLPDETQGPPSEAPPTIDAAVVPTNGLVGDWKLNETGGTTAVDSKNGHNATVIGGAGFTAGKLGNALNLNNGTAGTGGKYAQMPSNAALNDVQEGNYTISAWFYPYSIPPNTSSDNTFWMIVSKHGQHMGIVYNSVGRFVARHYLTGNVLEISQSSQTYPANAWYHVASVVSKTAGTVKIYVNGSLMGTATFTAGTAAREYGTTPFRIGRAETTWAADGKVDQVRIYDVALSEAQVADLYDESQFRFPVMMVKGQQIELLGVDPMPDGQTAASTQATATWILDSARAAGARVTIRVTGGNEDLGTDANPRNFSLPKWKSAFNNVSGLNANQYFADGTLIAHYAIDEPWSDFDNMTSSFLEQICQHQKSFSGWDQVPCFIRELNTKLYTERPAGGYQYVDGGWAQIADHHYNHNTVYNWDMGAYYRDNLAKGDLAGLWLLYGFNLINGGKEVPGCDKPADPNHHNCAMSPAEIRAVADTLAAIGNDKGCGVNGWWIRSTPGPERDYYFDQGQYEGNGIQGALQYLQNKVGGLRPAACNIR